MDRIVVQAQMFAQTMNQLIQKPENGVTQTDVLEFLSRFRQGDDVEITPYQGATSYNLLTVRSHDIFVLSKEIKGRNYVLAIGDEKTVKALADQKLLEVNPQLQKIQVYGQVPEDFEKEDPNLPTQSQPLFSMVEKDSDLLRLGVPESRIKTVRSIMNLDKWDALVQGKSLPDRVCEALTWLLQGEPLEEVIRAYQKDGADSRGSHAEIGFDSGEFVEVTSDEQLRQMLERPLESWRVFLHPDQRELVENVWRGAVRVSGGAGTGKTVVAIHRAVHLLNLPDWGDDDRLLFTTFSTNLAVDLRKQLDSLLTTQQRRRVDVFNIDHWIRKFLSEHHWRKQIVYSDNESYDLCWDFAYEQMASELSEWSEAFLRQEWEQVVLPQNCHCAQDYAFADRRGRARAISRSARRKIWPLFERMRYALDMKDIWTIEDASACALEILRTKFPKGLYRAVIVDEVQDFGLQALELLRAMTPAISKEDAKQGVVRQGDLFMVGDPRQRIYDRVVNFKKAGIQIQGRSRKLRVNYRTTEQIRRASMCVQEWLKPLPEDVETEAVRQGYVSLRYGQEPVVQEMKDFDEEMTYVMDQIQSLTNPESAHRYHKKDIVIVARENETLNEVEARLKNREDWYRIRRGAADDLSKPGVRLSTMHRIKGLEFKVVFLVNAGKDIVPKIDTNKDDLMSESILRREAALFHVTCSRAVDKLYVTCNGEPGQFMKKLMDRFNKSGKDRRHEI